MMTFACDICGVIQTRDEYAALWFTAAVVYGGKGLRLFRWPTGSNLREPHDSLHHVCCLTHLEQFVAAWGEKREVA